MKRNRSAPEATIVPILIYEDVSKAIDWLTGAFGFTERLRAEHGGVVVHAQLGFGTGAIIIGRAGGPFLSPRKNEANAYVHVTVENVNAFFERARQFGALVIQEPTDMPFGERQCTVGDHGGHRWTFSEHIADVAPEEWGARVKCKSAT